MSTLTPTLLLILDGWGLAPAGPSNATTVAHTPHMDALLRDCPHSTLNASGRAVGLPEGYIGNSEVGHLNIGAGSVVYQDMTRIDMAVEQGELDTNAVYLELVESTRRAGGRLHLAGLLSDGGVHSHINHLKALARVAVQHGMDVLVHCFTDGRDTGPHLGQHYLEDLQKALAVENAAGPGRARVASICGRFYAMDRDKRWDRVAEAYAMLVRGEGHRATDAVQAMTKAYAAGITDEFIKPTLLLEEGPLADKDGLFLFNFRADRMRELVQTLILADFDGFERTHVPQLAGLASMTAYDATFPLPVAFPKASLRMGLGEVISNAGLRQLRLAETEKYAHVTYFFNGGREAPLPGEERIMVPSPRDVATYDLAPAMSCVEVTDKFLEAWKSAAYSLVVCNLANGDMVGHTGVLPAAIAACEAVDRCVGRMLEAVLASGGRMLIIADHGNCETMLTPSGEPQTAHTTNPVPCILVQAGGDLTLKDGKLADVAPTLLDLWGLPPMPSMNGQSLVER